MLTYLIRRLILLPVTLLCIIIINFIIVNLAPGDPISATEISEDGSANRQEDQSVAFGDDRRYLQFREHYGLTLPILFNTWPDLDQEHTNSTLNILITKKRGNQELTVKEHNKLKVLFGDQSRYIMPKLLNVISDESMAFSTRQLAVLFLIRGGTRQAIIGSHLSPEQKQFNHLVEKSNFQLEQFTFSPYDTAETLSQKVSNIQSWYQEHYYSLRLEPNQKEKLSIFFFESRLIRYLSRVLTLDFGSLRNDSNRKVIDEVYKRFRYSLTLAVIPMFITFFFCLGFGLLMANTHNRWPDFTCNIIFLIFYAAPIFVVAPFLIEKIALHNHFPFTDIPIPLSGFQSTDDVYRNLTSMERLYNILQHLALPLIAIMYGGLATQSRLARTAFLEVMRQDYVKTARAKGLPESQVLSKYIGRNAAITIVTSVAGSLGVILGGSLIVETIFEINGFGRFFYEAVVNRDYNVIMFSALAGSTLTLIGYLLADIAYTILDPRVTLD